MNGIVEGEGWVSGEPEAEASQEVTGAPGEDLIVRMVEELCGSLLGLGNSTLVKLQTQIAT